MKAITFFTFALIVVAPDTKVVAQEADICGASGFQGLVGQDRALAEMLVLDGPMRIYATGDAVTLDMRPERINFVIDENGKISEVVCG